VLTSHELYHKFYLSITNSIIQISQTLISGKILYVHMCACVHPNMCGHELCVRARTRPAIYELYHVFGYVHARAL